MLKYGLKVEEREQQRIGEKVQEQPGRVVAAATAARRSPIAAGRQDTPKNKTDHST